MRLSKSDWDTLDTLIGRIGFGGYYDMVEVLKAIIINLYPLMTAKVTNETDIHTLITLLLRISKQVKPIV